MAVAAGMCFASIGTDTAGSVRIPASYSGIAGLKPTYGRVSLRGIIPLSWSLDHAGPMCKTVEDTAMMLNVVAGFDPQDTTTVDVPLPDYMRALRKPTSTLRLGLPTISIPCGFTSAGLPIGLQVAGAPCAEAPRGSRLGPCLRAGH